MEPGVNISSAVVVILPSSHHHPLHQCPPNEWCSCDHRGGEQNTVYNICSRNSANHLSHPSVYFHFQCFSAILQTPHKSLSPAVVLCSPLDGSVQQTSRRSAKRVLRDDWLKNWSQNRSNFLENYSIKGRYYIYNLNNTTYTLAGLCNAYYCHVCRGGRISDFVGH